jgi:acetyl-CoA carboxylase carboxyltransferase component
MSWRPEIEEIARRRAAAREMGGRDAVDKQHAQGRLTIRERIAALADDGSFHEVGALSGTGHDDQAGKRLVTPAPYVMGLAKIDGRDVAIGGEDFTVRGGSSWGGDRRKGGQGGFVEELAFHYRIPLVNLIDGAGGSVTTIRRRGHSIFPGVDGFERSVSLLGRVPVVSAVLGTAAGGPAGRAVLSHWSVMVQGTAQVFAAGPPVVKRSLGQELSKEELGGSAIAVDAAGTIDNSVQTEAECFAAIKRFLSFMPNNVWELPPSCPSADPPDRIEDALADLVPRDRRKPYDMRKLVKLVVDKESTFEIQPTFGQAVITILGRLNGKVVGIIASNPMFNGGAVDGKAARKQTHFVELCDAFHIPIVFFVDVPGFMVGLAAETAGTLRDGMRCVYALGAATIPMITLVIRKCYGMAGMATTSKNGLNLKIGWPSAEWGSLPIEGGAAAAFKREIEQAPNPSERLREIEEELRAYASPFRTAEAFGVEDIIDPRETRAYLCRFVDAVQLGLRAELGEKFRAGVRP